MNRAQFRRRTTLTNRALHVQSISTYSGRWLIPSRRPAMGTEVISTAALLGYPLDNVAICVAAGGELLKGERQTFPAIRFVDWEIFLAASTQRHRTHHTVKTHAMNPIRTGLIFVCIGQRSAIHVFPTSAETGSAVVCVLAVWMALRR